MVASYRLALTVLGVAATFADAGKDDTMVGYVVVGCSLCNVFMLDAWQSEFGRAQCIYSVRNIGSCFRLALL